MCQFLEKLIYEKKVTELFSKFFKGGPRPQGVPKFYDRVGVVDSGPPDLSNGVKNLALRMSHLELNVIFKKILNLIFSIFDSSIFPKFSGNVEGSIAYRYANFKKN